MSGGAGLGFVSGALAGRVFPLGPRVVVGRDPRNEVVFPPDTEGVSTRHAQVAPDPRDPTAHLVIDLQSRGGTFLDGERLPPNEPARLRPGMVLRFGATGPLAVYDALAALAVDDPFAAQAPLTVVREEGQGSWRLAPDRPTVVGRDRACDVVLDPERDSLASSRHARLTPGFGRAVLTDLGSANGTWIDGRRVTEATLSPGTVFRLGTKGPALRLAREAPTPPPTPRPATDRLAAPKPVAFSGRPPSLASIMASRPTSRGAAAPAEPVAAPAPTSTPKPTPRSGPAAKPAAPPPPLPSPPAPTPAAGTPALAPMRLESFRLEFTSADQRGRVHVFVKPEVQFGSIGALNDVVLRCFPRELENEKDASERSESIAPEHFAVKLTRRGVALSERGGATKVNGRLLGEGEEVDLDALADVWLGEDVLGLRARVLAHPRLPATDPLLGQEHKHPVECLVLERKGDGADHLYVMLVRQASIGASDDAAIRVPVAGVAPLHALLFVKQGRVWLSQLGESPVAVAGTPLRAGTAAPLEPGVRFFVGAASVEVHASDEGDFDPW